MPTHAGLADELTELCLREEGGMRVTHMKQFEIMSRWKCWTFIGIPHKIYATTSTCFALVFASRIPTIIIFICLTSPSSLEQSKKSIYKRRCFASLTHNLLTIWTWKCLINYTKFISIKSRHPAHADRWNSLRFNLYKHTISTVYKLKSSRHWNLGSVNRIDAQLCPFNQSLRIHL